MTNKSTSRTPDSRPDPQSHTRAPGGPVDASALFAAETERLTTPEPERITRAARKELESEFSSIFGFNVRLRRSKDGWRLLPTPSPYHDLPMVRGRRAATDFFGDWILRQPGHLRARDAANAAVTECVKWVFAPLDPCGEKLSDDFDHTVPNEKWPHTERMTSRGHARFATKADFLKRFVETLVGDTHKVTFSFQGELSPFDNFDATEDFALRLEAIGAAAYASEHDGAAFLVGDTNDWPVTLNPTPGDKK